MTDLDSQEQGCATLPEILEGIFAKNDKVLLKLGTEDPIIDDRGTVWLFQSQPFERPGNEPVESVNAAAIPAAIMSDAVNPWSGMPGGPSFTADEVHVVSATLWHSLMLYAVNKRLVC